jgi:hypothetical protein
MNLVIGMVDAFEEAAVSDTHTPALYASFLRVLVENRQGATTTAGPGSRNSVGPRDVESMAGPATAVDGSGPAARNHPVDPQPVDISSTAAPSVPSQSQPAVDESVFTSATMDTLLNQQGFWESVLMSVAFHLISTFGLLRLEDDRPGFGGPLQGLSGGGGTIYDPWTFSPTNSGRNTPMGFSPGGLNGSGGMPEFGTPL